VQIIGNGILTATNLVFRGGLPAPAMDSGITLALETLANKVVSNSNTHGLQTITTTIGSSTKLTASVNTVLRGVNVRDQIPVDSMTAMLKSTYLALAAQAATGELVVAYFSQLGGNLPGNTEQAAVMIQIVLA
jgi:hypothetical protein